MKLIHRIKKLLGIIKPSGRPRIPMEKRMAIKGAPLYVTDMELSRILKVSFTTIQRYRYADGKQLRPRRRVGTVQEDSQGTP